MAPRGGATMRIFSSARVAVIDADSDRRSALCAALAGFGMLQVLQAQSFDHAVELDREAPLDLCIARAGGANPFDPARMPVILLSADFSGDLRRAAVDGYRIVLPADASARIVYRRIGSVLQKIRRANRIKGPDLAALRASAQEQARGT